MKNLLLLIYLISINCLSQKKTIDKIDSKEFRFSDISYVTSSIIIDELKETELIKLKEYLISHFNKNLDSIGHITISYLQPQKDCWYDNYVGINNKKWNGTESLETQMNHQLILSYFDKTKSNYRVWDEKKIIYNIFPKANNACDYMVTINKNGVYLYKPGHFSVEVANAFYNELKVYE